MTPGLRREDAFETGTRRRVRTGANIADAGERPVEAGIACTRIVRIPLAAPNRHLSLSLSLSVSPASIYSLGKFWGFLESFFHIFASCSLY